MVASRPIGALILAACIAVIVAEIYFGLVAPHAPVPLAISLPVIAGVLAVAGFGAWMGWIMLTTPRAPPAPPKSEEEEERGGGPAAEAGTPAPAPAEEAPKAEGEGKEAAE